VRALVVYLKGDHSTTDGPLPTMHCIYAIWRNLLEVVTCDTINSSIWRNLINGYFKL